jgi:hypothetical protein
VDAISYLHLPFEKALTLYLEHPVSLVLDDDEMVDTSSFLDFEKEFHCTQQFDKCHIDIKAAEKFLILYARRIQRWFRTGQSLLMVNNLN